MLGLPSVTLAMASNGLDVDAYMTPLDAMKANERRLEGEAFS